MKSFGLIVDLDTRTFVGQVDFKHIIDFFHRKTSWDSMCLTRIFTAYIYRS